MELKFTVQTKIQKPVSEVFDAVYNPKKLSGYFTTGGSSGPLDPDAAVQWKFVDSGNEMIVPVRVQKMVRNQLIEFQWQASDSEYDAKTGKMPEGANYSTTVEIAFESLGENETLVRITEGKWRPTEGGLKGSYGNCQGWMSMVSCLKAYIEYGINLRKGAF